MELTSAIMEHLFGERRTFITITQLLSGLLLMGCLINSLATQKGALVCAEERVLETEVEVEDNNESRQLDLALDVQIGDRTSSQIWRNVQIFFFSKPGQVEQRSHFVRGPPRC